MEAKPNRGYVGLILGCSWQRLGMCAPEFKYRKPWLVSKKNPKAGLKLGRETTRKQHGYRLGWERKGERGEEKEDILK